MLSRRYPVRCTLRLQCMHGAHSVQARRHGARNAGDQPGKCLPLTLLSACVLLRSGKTVEEVWNSIHGSAQAQDPSGYQQASMHSSL